MQKIKLTGQVKKYRKIKNPSGKKAKGYWHLFEMTEGGSPAAPKNLPKSSKIHFTVIMNDRQVNKLISELEAHSLPFSHANLFVDGEMTLDLPMDVVEGEIGVVAYMVQSIDVTKIKAEQEEQPEAE